jgi:hypothetical protein
MFRFRVRSRFRVTFGVRVKVRVRVTWEVLPHLLDLDPYQPGVSLLDRCQQVAMFDVILIFRTY